jgi:two-component system, cell cycle sensor histidine kinase and response regulator CckA
MNVAENMDNRLSERESSVEYGFRATRKDGREIAVKVFGTSINYNGKRALCGTIIDVTREKTMESQLIQAQKMEAIGTLAGGIAHDFNNILGAMMGYAELSKLKTTDDRIQPYLEQLLKACDRAKDLVNQILTFSRKKDDERKPLSITPIAKEALKLLRSSLPTTIDVRIHFQNRQDKVLADATQIHQVLINLCTNASHAMRERGGILEITFSQEEITANGIHHDPALQRGLYLKIVISDTGCGIDASIRDKIFDPFFTTKGPGEGTGLGLAMVYGIIKNHGGVISVKSEPGKGTTFTIYLPLIDMEAQTEDQGMETIIGGKGHILLVDDEQPLASIGKEMLISLGYDVTVRFSSLDALEAFRANPHRFNLVITDTTMPNMTGPQMAKEMLKIYPGLPIILTTGYSDMINEKEAKEMGIQEFIMKPVSLQNLAQVVRKVLQS